jgi:hypothetical protein
MSWIKDLVQAVAFTAAGVWAIYNFWYRERYLPKTIDANVVVKSTLEKLGEKDGIVALRLSMVAENHGAAPARILGISRFAFGQRVVAAPPRDVVRPGLGGELRLGDYVELDQTLQTKGELFYNTLEVDEPFDGKSDVTIRPAGFVTEEHVLYVRRTDYAFLSAVTAVAWLPGAFPAPKECYTLARRDDGAVRIVVNPKQTRGNCRLSTSSGDASLSLW